MHQLIMVFCIFPLKQVSIIMVKEYYLVCSIFVGSIRETLPARLVQLSSNFYRNYPSLSPMKTNANPGVKHSHTRRRKRVS